MPRKPRLDLILYGATSFVGQIVAAELCQRYADGGLRWGYAGRSPAKLEALRTQLGAAAADVPLLVADAADGAALDRLCRQTRVVVSTVGPYALHGEPLVRACATSGTDYCDLTGETQWIRRMLDRYERVAQQSGARIVHCCGFDSVPSDLGVWVLQQHALQQFGEPLTTIRMRVARLRGAFSGGTVASLLQVVREATRDAEVRRLLADPYSLCPPEASPRPPQPDLRFARHDTHARSWIAPFVMSGINTRIVQRSQALGRAANDPACGDGLLYDEATLTGAGLSGRLKAVGLASAILAFMTASALPPSRWLLEKLFLPAPGEGPSPEARRKGGYQLRFHGQTAGGRTLELTLTGERDPGYGSTARILTEAASCLALDVPRGTPGGFWTPARLFGDRLRARLEANAGVTFAVQTPTRSGK